MKNRLLCLHGFTGRGEDWSELLELAGRERELDAWCPDLLGHGEASSSAEDFDGEVERLAGGLEARSWGSVTLLGYSLGARVGLVLLARHSELFRRAVLVGARPGIEDIEQKRERLEADERWARLLEDRGLRAFVEAWESLPLFASQAEAPRERLEAQRRRRLAQDAHGLARALRILGWARMPRLRAELGRVRVPTILVVGELDDEFRAAAEELERLLPDARVVVAPGRGHNVVLEDPEWLASRLIEELER